MRLTLGELGRRQSDTSADQGKNNPYCECSVEGDGSVMCIRVGIVLPISSLHFSSVSRAATN